MYTRNRLRLNKPLLIALKLLIYSLIYYSFLWMLTWLWGRPLPSTAFLLTIMLIVVYRGKLTEVTQKIIDKSFYHKLYRLKKAVRTFNAELNSTIEYDILLQKSLDFLAQTFNASQYAIYLYKGVGFERLPHNGDALSPASISPFPAETLQQSPFGQPIQFYQIEALWKEWPAGQPLLAPGYRDKRFAYFLPLKGSNHIIGFLLFHESVTRYLNIPEVKEFLLELFNNAAEVLENAQIHRDIKRKSLESALLLEIIQNITATLHLEEVLRSIVNNLSKLVSFDAAAIFLLNETQGTLQQTVATGYEASSREIVSLKINQGISGWVIRNKKSIIIPDVSQNPNYYAARPQTNAQITVPIINRGDAIGALVLESDEIDHFSHADLQLMELFSGMAAIAIRNARLYEDSLKKKRLESDLLDASTVQKALLPRRVPAIKGLNIEVLSIPSQIVGGDLYDVFRLRTQQQGIAIGDVSGKGAPAAILMAVAYAGFKSLLKEINPVVTVIAKLNNFLVEATSTGHYVTFFYGVLDYRKRRFVYCNAGHNPPILIRKDRSIHYLKEGGVVLGFLANQQYTQAVLELDKGDYLCFYTDGITEIQNSREEEFGEERLVRLLQKNYGKTPKEIRLAIVEEITQFAKSIEYQDDVTLLIVQVE